MGTMAILFQWPETKCHVCFEFWKRNCPILLQHGCPSVAFSHFLRIDFQKTRITFLRVEREFSNYSINFTVKDVKLNNRSSHMCNVVLTNSMTKWWLMSKWYDMVEKEGERELKIFHSRYNYKLGPRLPNCCWNFVLTVHRRRSQLKSMLYLRSCINVD